MRNIHEREKEKIIMSRPQLPFDPINPERELREQKLKRDFATPIPVFYIVTSIAIVLLILVGIVFVYGFHFW
jgi:hypothetical protein